MDGRVSKNVPMTQGVSVILCCYNSERNLPKTIEAIANQKLENYFPWEVILVDNYSTDRTIEVARMEWAKHSANAEFSVVSEPEIGLSSARARGFETAKYEFCLFCDDDNWLGSGYLDRAFATLSQDERIGVLGGRGIEVCETQAPAWFDGIKGGYAVGEQAQTSEDVTDSRGFVYGAAAVFRKSVYLKLRQKGFKTQLTDRKGNSLSSGGDKELCYAFKLAGSRIFYSHENTFCHFIPKWKLTKAYVNRLYAGFSAAQPILTLYEYVINDQVYKNKKKERTPSLLWAKDIVYTLYLFFVSFKEGSAKVRMQFIVLVSLLKLMRSYQSTYLRILALVD